jgi:hypothetical protein
MSSVEETERYRQLLENCLTELIKLIGPIRIGTPEQFPYGWRKAAKGRTVWRILEEAITQNLEKHHKRLGLIKVLPSSSEVSVFDCQLFFPNCKDLYINVKSAVKGRRPNKDDISKAAGLQAFYEQDITRELFIATFVIDFKDDMQIALLDCYVMPIAWLPDIYVNPSNNGNLQSSKYKDVVGSARRTNEQFLTELTIASEKARKKREKIKEIIEVVADVAYDQL